MCRVEEILREARAGSPLEVRPCRNHPEAFHPILREVGDIAVRLVQTDPYPAKFFLDVVVPNQLEVLRWPLAVFQRRNVDTLPSLVVVPTVIRTHDAAVHDFGPEAISKDIVKAGAAMHTKIL